MSDSSSKIIEIVLNRIYMLESKIDKDNAAILEYTREEFALRDKAIAKLQTNVTRLITGVGVIMGLWTMFGKYILEILKFLEKIN